jgi:LysM repeat protein
MKVLIKLLVVVGLSLVIFGGGGLLGYRLFFKNLGSRQPGKGQAVAAPTPDPGVAMLDQAKQHLAKGAKTDARQVLSSLIQSFPKSGKADEAKKILGDLNIQDFFSTQPGPDKGEYTVIRGDSVARIAAKTKTPVELIFKANGLESLIIQPGTKYIIPKGQFSVVIGTKAQDLTLLNHGTFFRWYKPIEFNIPAKVPPGQYKVHEKIAWAGGSRVAFGTKNYMGSSRWIVVNHPGVVLFSETNPQAPNIQKPNSGIMLTPPDMEELFALVGKETPIIVQ